MRMKITRYQHNFSCILFLNKLIVNFFQIKNEKFDIVVVNPFIYYTVYYAIQYILY